MHSDDLNNDIVIGPLYTDWKELNKLETAPELPQGLPIHVDSGGEPSDSQCRDVDLLTENFALFLLKLQSQQHLQQQLS